MMKDVLKILIAEHDKHDLEIMEAELKKGNIDFVSRIVQTEAAYSKALQTFLPDIILCDYNFPSFDGPTAFKIREELAPGIPFILVSGTIGEEKSIELIKNGVTDFVLKDKMFTLNIKLSRALKDAREWKEKEKAGQDLERVAAHLAEAQSLAKLGSWDYDIATNKLTWSDQLYKVFDTDKQTFTGTHGSFLALLDEADREHAERTSRHTQETGDTFITEYHITTPNGEKRVIQEHGYGVKNPAGKVIRLFGTAQDITESKNAALALKKAFDEKNSVLESINDGFFATDINSVVTYWNKKAEALLGEKRESIIGKNLHDMFASPDSKGFYDQYQKAIREKSTVHFEEFSKRSNKWFAVSAFASENGMSVYFKDVTERKKDEEKLRESELRYRQIVETAQEGIWLIDENNKTTFVNDKMCEILEYTREEIICRTNLSFKTAEDQEFTLSKIESRKKGVNETYEAGFITKTGRHILTSVSTNPLPSETGAYVGALGMVTDITQRKKAEKKDQFQATLLNTIGQATIATDMEGSINFWNKAASTIYGWSEEEVIGRNINDITPVLQTKEEADQIMQDLLLGKTWSGEFLVKRKDGGEFPAFVTNAPVYDQHRQLIGVIGVSTDITSRRRAELLLKESNARYNLISQATNDMVWDWDLLTGKVYRNKEGWKKIFRTSDDEIDAELLGDWNSRVHPEDMEKIKTVAEEIKKQAKDFFEIECRVLRDDGTYAFIHDRGHIMRNEQGLAVRLIGATQDITERKRAEQEMTWLINNTEESFILLNTNLDIISFNSQFQQLYLKYMKIPVVKGRCILDYAQPGKRSLVKEIYERVLLGAEEESEINIPLPLNAVKSFAIKYKPAKDEHGTIIGVFVSAVDITEKKKAAQQLDIQEKRYRALVENGADAVVILSPRGTLQYASPAVHKILGYTEEELSKTDMFACLHPDDVAEISKIWEQVIASPGISIAGPAGRVLHKNGSWRWMEATLTNMLHDPAINGIVDNFRDVTEKIESELLRGFERRDKEALINTTNDFMWSVTTDFRLIAANEAFIKYMKNSLGTGTLQPGDKLLIKEKFPAAYLAVWRNLYNSALGGESIVKEMHSPAAGGNPEQWFETTVNPIYNNDQVTGIACYSRNTTERMLSEIHLKQLNENLQKQAKELVFSNAELEQFAYVASHDLQEPLRMVTSFLTQLEKKYGNVIDAKGKQYIAFAVDGAKRMRQIILDLLEFSRVSRTEDAYDTIDLNALVGEIRLLFRKQIQEKKAVINSDMLPHVQGYRSPLRQVFQNLIGNALKFMSADRQAEINITCIEFIDHWQFTVRDNGIGIDDEYLEKIFIIFQRLHTRDEFPGTGMGLAITRKIIENQGGKIWVQSEEGKGSTFYFTLTKN